MLPGNTSVLTILGKSEPVISMICDNLESCNDFPKLVIINNLKQPDNFPYINSKFAFTEKDSLENTTDSVFTLGVGITKSKLAVFDTFNVPIEKFVNLIHWSSQLSSNVELGQGILINSLVSVAAWVQIGNFVTINRNASVGHHTIIKDFVAINPGAVVCGKVNIGAGTTIGAGAVVIDGISIGKNCTIGAGSIVTKDIPDNVIAYGNPCQIIRSKI